MEAVIGLLLMLLGLSNGVETSCDGRQDGAQCYGALGGTVVIKLMDNTSEVNTYQWIKNKTEILRGRRNRIFSNLIGNRSVFTPSEGTFRINNLNRSDGGEYTLETFESSGWRSGSRTLQLMIEAPVSSVQLVPQCLSQGEMRVSCSSETGDSPQYSWTLNGQTLTDTQLLSGSNESKSITLKQDVSGKLFCSVRNHISGVSGEKDISTCGFIFIECISNGTNISKWVFEANNTLCIKTTTASTPTSTEGKETGLTESLTPSTNITSTNQPVSRTDDPWYIKHMWIMAGVLSAMLLLLVVGIAVVCAHKKKQNNKPKDADEQELTYADVTIMQRQERQVKQRAETVEYGQVKFSERPPQTAQPAGGECVYAMVRKER